MERASEKELENGWEIIHYFRSTSQRGSVQGDSSQGTKETMPFSSLTPLHKHTATGRNQLSSYTGCLTCLYQNLCPSTLVGLPFLVKLASLPMCLAPLQEDQHKSLSTQLLKTGVLRVCKLGWDRDKKVLCFSWKEGREK